MNKESIPAMKERIRAGRFCFVSDDLHPEDLHRHGHLNHVLRKAVPLEVGGLMSRSSLGELIPQITDLSRASASLGCTLKEPFMALSFLALPVIPELKLTDMGLVDVKRFELAPLFY